MSFRKGDFVQISLPIGAVQEITVRDDSWNDEITELLDKPGTVCDCYNDYVYVQYDLNELKIAISQRCWTFRSIMLKKIDGSTSKTAQSPKTNVVCMKKFRCLACGEVFPMWTKRIHEVECVIKIASLEYESPIYEDASAYNVPGGGTQTHKRPSCGKVQRTNVAGNDVVKELKELKEEKKCKICLDVAADIAFIPCGHRACGECSVRLNTCHICRVGINDKLKIF